MHQEPKASSGRGLLSTIVDLGRSFVLPLVINKVVFATAFFVFVFAVLSFSIVYHLEIQVVQCRSERASTEEKIKSCDDMSSDKRRIWAEECANAQLEQTSWRGISCRTKTYDIRPWELLTKAIRDAFSNFAHVQLLYQSLQALVMLSTLVVGGITAKRRFFGEA